MREIAVILKGVRTRLDREHNERAWAVWHVEALSRSKKLPKLEKLMVKGKRQPARRKSADELIAMAHLWTAATTRH